jgi:hypothetical protein
MTVAKNQISLFMFIWVAVTTVLTFPVQAASLDNTPFPTTQKQIKVKDTALLTPQPDIIDSPNIYINNFYRHQPNYQLQLPPSHLSESIVQLEEASKVTQDTVGDKTIYTYNANTTNNQSLSRSRYSSNRWQLPKTPPRKTVPESSPIIGLLVFTGLLMSKKLKGNREYRTVKSPEI